MTRKILTVATEIQAAVFNQVLLSEISTGFWRAARPADHASYWKGVEVVVGTELGISGFDAPRNYNFVNPEFFAKSEEALLAAAKTADANVTSKQLKKQLISLNQIVGSRLKEVNGKVSKLGRGRKQNSTTTETSTSQATSTRKVAATFVDEAVAV